MAINLRTYKKPSTPSAIPPFPSPDCAARPAKSLVGAPHICRLLRRNPPSTVNQALPHPAHSLSFTLAHPLKPSVGFISQQIELLFIKPKLLPPCTPPAAPQRRTWTQSTTPTKFSSPPCLPDHRRDIAAVQNSPEHRRSSTSGRYLDGKFAGDLATVSTLSLSSSPVRS
jgi:hypothetical protein